MKTLIVAWLKAKNAEDRAKGKRHAIEAKIDKMLDGKPEGTTSKIYDEYKVTVTRKLKYTVDMDVWNSLPLIMQDNAPVRRKVEVDVKKYKENPFPELVIVKPVKPSIEIERIEQ